MPSLTAITASAASNAVRSAQRTTPVAAAELLGLPRPVRLERVRGQHVRDAVQQRGEVAGQVGVPGVGVHDVAAGAIAAAIDRSTDSVCSGGVGAAASRGSGVCARASGRSGPKQCTSTSRPARRSSRDQVLDVHAGSAVDLRRATPGSACRSSGRCACGERSGTGVSTWREQPASARHRPRRRRGQAAVARSRPTAPSRRSRSAGSTGWSTSCCPTWSTRATCASCVLTQYKSHSLDRHITTTWRMSTLLGNYVTPVPAQQRLGPQWFRGSGRRDPPEPEPRATTTGPTTSWSSAPTTSTGWTRARWSTSTSRAAPASPSRASGCRARRRPSSASSRRPRTAGGSTRSSRSPPTRRACPTTRPARSPRWATTSSPPRRCSTRCARDADDDSSVHDMGGNIIPMLVAEGQAEVYDFRGQRRARLHRPRPRLLARRRHARQLLRRAHGPHLGPPGLQPLQPALADLHQHGARTRRRSSCSTSRAAWAWRSAVSSARA